MTDGLHDPGRDRSAWRHVLPFVLPIRQAWLVILLGLVFGTALAGVEATLGPQIKLNRENETKGRIPELVPGALPEKTEKIEFQDERGQDVVVYKAVGNDKSLKGWVIPTKGQGFVDVIELLIGVDPQAETITGLFVLAQKETPGLGSSISEGPKFCDQFAGKPTSPGLEVNKKEQKLPHEVKPVTSATISSQSVCDIINTEVARQKARLKRMAAGGPPTLQ